MKLRMFSAIVVGLALSAASAQVAPATPPAGQGQRGGGRGGMGMGWGMGGGVTGTVTEAAADHYTIKTDEGESYTVHISVNTRIMKQMVQRPGAGGGNPPQPLKATDIKVGDVVAALGEVDAAAKSIGAALVLQIDPERAKQMREQRANYGKTWLMGKVTAINETKVTLEGSLDKAAHTFVADENTTFRKRRDPITLADIQMGDVVRAEGTVKDGIFVATAVSVMGMPPGGTPMVPHEAVPAPQGK